MAVVGAKLSEGLNFSDDLARAVVLIGLPFPNLASAELKERMRYVSELERRAQFPKRSIGGRDAGAELYENLAMKAVNQSIGLSSPHRTTTYLPTHTSGRAIRHRNDWAALILLDVRYGSSGIRAKLPAWIAQDLSITPTFGNAIKSLSEFYRTKKHTPAL